MVQGSLPDLPLPSESFDLVYCMSVFTHLADTTDTSYSDSGLTASTDYTYRVRASDAAGNLGPYSDPASAMTAAAPDTQPPSKPAALLASASGSDTIGLSWDAATDDRGVTGYQIERCQGATCTNFAQIAAPGGTRHSSSRGSARCGARPPPPWRRWPKKTCGARC